MTLLARSNRPEHTDEIRSLASPLVGSSVLDRLLDRIGDARYVLLGEASQLLSLRGIQITNDTYGFNACSSLGGGSQKADELATLTEAPLMRALGSLPFNS